MKMIILIQYMIITEPACKEGEIPLSKTMKCQGYGYTCLLNVDGPGCCSSRQEEKRPCVPCDETYLKKSSGYYNQAGSCDFIPGTKKFGIFRAELVYLI